MPHSFVVHGLFGTTTHDVVEGLLRRPLLMKEELDAARYIL